MQQAEEILTFWFGALDPNGWTADDSNPLWFAGRREDDEEIRRRFGARIDDACNGKLADWEAHSDAGNMALLLLTDQMTRAVYRGSKQAFAGDALALAVCKNGIASGRHKRLPLAWRRFYYLPLEHSENLLDQQQCVALYRQLQQDHPQYEKALTLTLDYAVKHYDIIKRFGRFPHRNAVLGRTNTEEEERYLTESNEHFGQKADS